MNAAKPASFNFEKYKIKSFSFSEPSTEQPTISINFSPSGIYFQETGIFVMTFDFVAIHGEVRFLD